MKLPSVSPNLCILLLLCSFTLSCHGIKILVYSGVSTTSQNMILHPIATRLAENGHNITFLTPSKISSPHPKIHYFYPPSVVDHWAETMSYQGRPNDRKEGKNSYAATVPLGLCREMMASQEVRDWIGRETFDHMILNACFNECGLVFAYKFNTTYTTVQTAPLAPWLQDMYGIPVDSSVIPDHRFNYTQDMTYYQRVVNTLSSVGMYMALRYFFFPEMEGYMREAIADPNMPGIDDLLPRVRLMLLNSYFAAEYAHSLPPMVIPVGGLHCLPSNDSLPKNILDFIDRFPTQGFVYVSFGTVFKPSPELEAGLLKILSTKFLQIGFIIKWNGEIPENPPTNILPVKFAPQQLLLAHPNIRGFLSQCGMLSVQEAAWYGVPVIGVPGRIDQDYNTECLVRLGVAVRLEMVDMTMDQLEAAIREILENKSYMERMKKLSEVYRDRPQSPLDTAIWWIEYVIRNEKKGNDLTNIISLGMSQTWWERRLLDVWFLVFSIVIILVIVIFKIGRVVVRKVWKFLTTLRDIQKLKKL